MKWWQIVLIGAGTVVLTGGGFIFWILHSLEALR